MTLNARIRLASDPKTSPTKLHALASDEMPGVRLLVVKNPSTSAETLSHLAHDTENTVRAVLASNVSAPPDTLAMLAFDTCATVRIGVAKNPNTPAATLTKLTLDLFSGVREAALKNARTPRETVQRRGRATRRQAEASFGCQSEAAQGQGQTTQANDSPTFVWMKKPGKDWVQASIPLTHDEAIAHAKLSRRAYIGPKRWRVSKTKPVATSKEVASEACTKLQSITIGRHSHEHIMSVVHEVSKKLLSIAGQADKRNSSKRRSTSKHRSI